MAYTPTTWVEGVTTLGPTNMNHLETGLQTAAATADSASTTATAAIPKSTVTTAGDLIYATGSAAVARLGVGTATQVLGGGASAPAWVTPPAFEYAYNEFTSNVSITATSEATANTIVTATAVAFDGSTTVVIEFFCPVVVTPSSAGSAMRVALYDGSSSIGIWDVRVRTTDATADSGDSSTYLQRRLTPSAATKTYSARAYVSTGTGVFGAGAGGLATQVPGFIRIRKV